MSDTDAKKTFWAEYWQWILGAAAACFLAVCGFAKWAVDEAHKHEEIRWRNQQEATRRDEAERQRQAEIPVLKFVGNGRFDDKGNSILSLEHQSKTQATNISDVTLTIVDPQQLNTIRRAHPIPRSYGGGGAQAANHVDDVFFREGNWRGDDCYCYIARVGLHVPPGPASDLRLAIIDPKLVGQSFSGELQIMYSIGEGFATSLTSQKVIVKARAKE